MADLTGSQEGNTTGFITQNMSDHSDALEKSGQKEGSAKQDSLTLATTKEGTIYRVSKDLFMDVTLDSDSSHQNKGCVAKVYPSGFKQECKEVIKLAWPIVLTQLFQYFLTPMAIIFCGHLGKVELDAVALASSMISVTALTIALGLATACDTLFAQIYGSVNREELGIALQRSLLIMALGTLPCFAVHLNLDSLLLLAGQDPEVVELTGRYIVIVIPGIFAFFMYITLSRYIQNQNIVYPNLIIGLLCNGVNALLHYVFIYVLDLSTDGSAVSICISYICLLVFTLIYIVVSGVHKETWTGWDMECLQDWGVFMQLAGFGLLMICIEWWAFELGVLLAGVLGTTDLGAQSVVFQIEFIAYMLPLGTGIAASIRVGQYLGSADANGALTAARVSFTVIGCSGLIVGILIIALAEYLPLIFTNVEEVADLATQVLPILGVYMFFDSIAGVGSGILRGCGRQKIGAAFVGVGFTIALAIGGTVMFETDLGIIGLWIVLAVSLCLEGITFFTMVNLIDWNKEVDKAQDRVKACEDILEDNEDKTETDLDNSDENTALLGSDEEKRRRRHSPYLVSQSSDKSGNQRSFSNSYNNPFPGALPRGEHLTNRQLLIRRSAAVGLMLLILTAGILGRVLYRPEYQRYIETCIPIGQTPPINSTLPMCATTAVDIMTTSMM